MHTPVRLDGASTRHATGLGILSEGKELPLEQLLNGRMIV